MAFVSSKLKGYFLRILSCDGIPNGYSFIVVEFVGSWDLGFGNLYIGLPFVISEIYNEVRYTYYRGDKGN